MVWLLAHRNLWRNRRRTGLTLAAMAIAVAVLVVVLAVAEGITADLLRSTTGAYTGQAAVAAAGYFRDGEIHAVLRDPEGIAAALGGDARVAAASPRLRGFVLVSHGDSTVPGELLGVDWDAEARVSTLARSLVAGFFPAGDGGDALVLGTRLAERLGAGPGAEVAVVAEAADGSLGSELFTVAGIFRTGSFARDSQLALAGRERVGRLLALEGAAHEIALGLVRPAEAAAVAAAAERTARGLQADAAALPWQRLLPMLARATAVIRSVLAVTVVVVLLAAALVVVNTLLMSFQERVRESGVLMALGMSPGLLRRCLLAEALLLGILAAGAGAGIGTGASLALERRGLDLSGRVGPVSFGGGTIPPVLHASLRPRDVALPALGIVALSLAAGLLPAVEAGRRRPAEDLQGGIAA